MGGPVQYDPAGRHKEIPIRVGKDEGRMRGKAGRPDRGDKGGKQTAEGRGKSKLKKMERRIGEENPPVRRFSVSVGKPVVWAKQGFSKETKISRKWAVFTLFREFGGGLIHRHGGV